MDRLMDKYSTFETSVVDNKQKIQKQIEGVRATGIEP